MKKYLPILMVILLIGLIGYTTSKQAENQVVPEVVSDQIEDYQSQNTWIEEIYYLEDVDYKMYSYELLDTYMIACALYFDFKSDYIMPRTEDEALYQEVKAYFIPYKNHEFVLKLGEYVDMQNKDVNGSVVYPLIMYALSDTYYGMGVNQIQTTVFEDREAFNLFLEELKAFYKETNAEAFFDRHAIKDSIQAYIKKEINFRLTTALFKEMEVELGNTETIPNHYIGILSVFRPNMGSAYTVSIGTDRYFVLQASPNGREKKPEEYDMDMLLNTTIHEFLHLYINDEVAELKIEINKLADGKVKAEYVSSLYQNMEWHRVVDENLVRAIEAYLYAQSYGDESKAYKEILEPEIKSGFYKVDNLYQAIKTGKEKQNERIIDCISMLTERLFII